VSQPDDGAPHEPTEPTGPTRTTPSSRSRAARVGLVAAVVVGALAVGAGAWAVAREATDDGGSSPSRAASTTASRDGPTTTDRPPTTSTPPTTGRGPRGSGEPVRIAFGGDIHFEGGLRTQLDADPAAVLAPVAPVLSAADLAVVNLETAITERGDAAPKQFTFRAPAAAFDALAAAGVDVASMANNHGLDYGPVGLLDSIAAARAKGFPIVGIGRNATEAYAPYRATVRGQRIAVIGATQVLDGNLIASWTATDAQPGLASAKEVDRLTAAVRGVRPTADTVVVFLHWGIERQTCPSGDQQALARALVDAGADVVVGGHAHRLQGGGRLGDAFVAYGLGNFVFYTEGGPGAQSGVLEVTVTGRHVDGYRFVPAVLQGGVATPLGEADTPGALAQWEALRECTGLAP
jgi:poly-gamma-glutamate synthesis protein (capsule biosynthesis protein)